jgi:23S rRNA maturation mini-RNase III
VILTEKGAFPRRRQRRRRRERLRTHDRSQTQLQWNQKLFGELKKETRRTRNQRARKSRKRVDHQKYADLNPH